MKVVLAPDKFAGTLTAAAAAEAMADGWASVRPDDELVHVPMADGGEGTVDVVAASRSGTRIQTAEVADARGRATGATWLLLPDGTAFVEAAQACGLSRLADDERNPRRTTTYGVGQLLRAAEAAGARSITVGVGGTATVDGGAGMAIALGAALRREDGTRLKVGGEHGAHLDRIDPGQPVAIPVTAACDVRAPLLGPSGAAAVFGPQKGAAPEDLEVLENALGTFADVAERDLPGGPWRDLPGAGAGGGLGFGLAAFAGARLVGGAALVSELVGLAAAFDGAGAVVTGEGQLDATSLDGKVTGYVAECAAQVGARVLAVVGSVSGGVPDGFDAVAPLGPKGPMQPAEAVREQTAGLARRL